MVCRVTRVSFTDLSLTVCGAIYDTNGTTVGAGVGVDSDVSDVFQIVDVKDRHTTTAIYQLAAVGRKIPAAAN